MQFTYKIVGNDSQNEWVVRVYADDKLCGKVRFKSGIARDQFVSAIETVGYTQKV